ncbi:hypothetical protein G195_004855 [Phytophthora kernoviae 00238/432]|uniref:YetF C-terminal domain-containing protein n=1 Tax=Phytophthora kernoviae 00238/432 TaxID=1284355 RepID=A0A8J4W8M7_9STRA|nr:hypothetical protein G195_004855 [Phytophthora kernoviae 00238/432]
MYFIVYGSIRIMGKREIGKLSMFDLVVSIMLAEIAAFVIEDTNKPLSHGIVPMLTVLVVQIAMAFLSLKSRKLRLMIDGKPTVLISKGKLHRDSMSKQRYNLDDLLLQLREQNIDSIGDVDYAILETTGKLTVFPKAQSSSYEGLPLPLIMDGKVQDQNLELIEKTRFWLKNQIQQKGILEFKDVFICSIDHNGKIYVSSKNDKE